jgi:hypothetical protein
MKVGSIQRTLQIYYIKVVSDPDCIKRIVDHLFNDAIKEGEAIKICRQRDGAEGTIRFIPTKSRMMDISSIRIREVIKLALPQEQLLKELQQLVLYPEILLELILQKCSLQTIA